MPKKKVQTKQKTVPKTQVKNTGNKPTFIKFYKNHRVIGVILMMIGAWALVWLGQAGVERYNFYRVEKTMDSITGQINSSFRVLNEHKVRACGTRDEAFGSHLGGCSITYTYEVSAGKNSKGAAQEIDKMIQKRKDVREDNPDPTQFKNVVFVAMTKLNINDPERYSSSYSFNNVSNPTCEVLYILPSQSIQEKYINVSISCFLTGRDAKLPYFPLQN